MFSEVRRWWSSRRGCKLVQSRGHGDGPPEVAVVLELVESELGHVLSRDAPPLRDAVDPQDVLLFGRLVRQSRGTYDHPVKAPVPRSEEHTSELQSRQYLVCRLLLEKKKTSTNA